MRQIIFFSIFAFALYSCGGSSAQETFPDQVNVAKTDKLKRIKGTKLFVSAPANYTPIESMVRLQKDNYTYLQVLEIPNTNFNEYKNELTKESFERKGAKVDIVKPVIYTGYDALFFSGPSKKPGETKLGLAFGDQTFAVMIVGVCKTDDKKGNEELKQIFANSYYDKSYELNPMELASFTFDESITGFKYATTMSNLFVYTPNGKSDFDNKREDLPTFQFTTLEAPSFPKAKEFLDYTISRYSVQGIEVSNVTKNDLIINDNHAYEVTMVATNKDNKKALLHQVIIHKDTKAVVFMGTDTEGKWLEKFRATAKSIKIP